MESDSSNQEIIQSLGIHAYKGEGSWLYDVKAESAALNTTGGRVWGAATRLATYMEKEWTHLFPVLPGGPRRGARTSATTTTSPSNSFVNNTGGEKSTISCKEDAAEKEEKATLTGEGEDESPEPRKGLRILELGAGLGWLGMTIARNEEEDVQTVCLTEQRGGGAVQWLQHNVDINRHLPGVPLVSALGCDWTDFRDDGPAWRGSESDLDPDLARILSERWDVVIGSDLVYNADGARLLPRVIRALAWGTKTQSPVTKGTSTSTPVASTDATETKTSTAERAPEKRTAATVHDPRRNFEAAGGEKEEEAEERTFPVVLYAHTKHRFDVFDVDLFEAFEECGLEVREVHEEGVETPPPSPPPLTSLFPEMRVAVYRITLKRTSL